MNCNFQDYQTVYGVEYTCVARTLQTSLRNRTITEVIGVHAINKKNSDVRKFLIQHQSCPYLPLNIGKFFPNLEIFYAMKSNVQQIITGDLDGLEFLKIFDVSYNPVEQIPTDFFSNHASIKVISFYDSHIKKVERAALNQLVNIERMHFENNVCVNQRFDVDFSESIEEVAEEIYDKCTGEGFIIRDNQAEVCGEMKTKLDNSSVRAALVDSSSKSSWQLPLILLLAFTTLSNIVFIITLIRIYKNNFNSNWHEMRNVLV